MQEQQHIHRKHEYQLNISLKPYIVQIVVFFKFFFWSADITNKQAGWSLTYCFPLLMCREEKKSSLFVQIPLL